jgi:photosystem II stability/assembly factor-like uncharacterized protein
VKTLLSVLLVLAGSVGYPVWVVQTSGTDTNLRGVSLAYSRAGTAGEARNRAGGSAVWASGSNGVILRSTHTVEEWTKLTVRGGETLDFRGIQAFDEKTAYVMSSGSGNESRIYKTIDGGETWVQQFTDSRSAFFLDALVCDGPTRCFALSDPVDGKFLVVATTDGQRWNALPQAAMPAALKDEGAFAASGTCLALYGNDIYFVTGGPAARLFHSPDLGHSWTVTTLPIVSGNPGAGAFSVARRGKNMAVMGGDYKNPESADRVAAYSRDAGRSWKPAKQMPGGYRSAVVWLDDRTLATVGPSGEEISVDGGAHWKPNSSLNLNAVAAVDFEHAWAVGANGTICHFSRETQ